MDAITATVGPAIRETDRDGAAPLWHRPYRKTTVAAAEELDPLVEWKEARSFTTNR